MPISNVTEADRPLCARVAKACREDPIGSLFLPDRVVLIELALPWAEDIWASPHVSPELRDAIALLQRSQHRTRCYAIAPDAEYSSRGYTRVLTLSRPLDLFVRFEKQEYLVPTAQAPDLLRTLSGPASALNRLAAGASLATETRDLLVCTHGSKDACCGRLGYPLYQLLREEYAPAASQPLRIWRVSHIGGHRFAPTLIDFPEGHGWAYLEPELLNAIINRSAPVHELMPYYRGWGGLNGYYLQLAERAILLREGWRWLAYRRAGMVLQGKDEGYPICDDEPEDSALVRIDYRSPDGRHAGSYEATIECFGRIQTALSCNRRDLQMVHQYHVSDLRACEPAEGGVAAQANALRAVA